MSLSQRYLETMLKLLPLGKAWRVDPDSDTYKLLSGFAPELARVDQRVKDLSLEMHPQTANELFEEWELEFGTPFDCGGVASTMAQRRADLISKITSLGGQSEPYFEAFFGPELGDVTFTYGQSSSVGIEVGGNLDYPEQYTAYVNIPDGEIDYFEAGDMAGDPLVQGAHSIATCLVEKYKPANIHLLFTYDPGV